MTEALQHAAETRIKTIFSTSGQKRHVFAQHLTPPETARFAASMFSDEPDAHAHLRCLDLGAGTGILSIALFERYGKLINRIDAVEADDILGEIYKDEIARFDIPYRIFIGDALTDAPTGPYDRIILNPPYKKMKAEDPRQALLPCHSANLYSAFIAIGLSRLSNGGELVAIVPRSWMNGRYFTSFRKYALDNFSLDAMHIYGSRTEVFADTNVLQETMLVRFSKHAQAAYITVTQSDGKRDTSIMNNYAANKLIDSFNHVVRIAPKNNGTLFETINTCGLCPSTGKVVDFRSRNRIYKERPNNQDIYRLIYSGNFLSGDFQHPLEFGKPQWYRADDGASIHQLTESGAYVIVKRFSSKEERRRVVAYPLQLDEPAGIENHLNFIHAGKPRKVVPLSSMALAQGLALWLNSTYIDEWFRDVSGSTQVNAGDIKTMPCPSTDRLEAIGPNWYPNISQSEIDNICEALR